MIRHFDHVTLAVADLERAKRFFALLGFVVDKAVVIEGERFARYMDVPGLVADHVTLVAAGVEPRLEVQLLHYRQPPAAADASIRRLDKLGYNHVCFAVDDLAATLARLAEDGIRPKGEVLDFHARKLAFVVGPEGVTIELSEWH